jgi:transcriptional regulator with XRE-family HTH domain
MELIGVNNNLRRIRLIRNYTQDYVAEQLGVSSRAYAQIEFGGTSLTTERINQLSKILKVSPFHILYFDEKQIFCNCHFKKLLL